MQLELVTGNLGLRRGLDTGQRKLIRSDVRGNVRAGGQRANTWNCSWWVNSKNVIFVLVMHTQHVTQLYLIENWTDIVFFVLNYVTLGIEQTGVCFFTGGDVMALVPLIVCFCVALHSPVPQVPPLLLWSRLIKP